MLSATFSATAAAAAAAMRPMGASAWGWAAAAVMHPASTGAAACPLLASSTKAAAAAAAAPAPAAAAAIHYAPYPEATATESPAAASSPAPAGSTWAAAWALPALPGGSHPRSNPQPLRAAACGGGSSGATLGGHHRALWPLPMTDTGAGWQAWRGATKKAGGTASQKKPPLPKNLGIKIGGGEIIFPGQIIVRQRGTQFHPGSGVGIGRDHTLFATRVGRVRFSDEPRPGQSVRRRRPNKVVSVAPLPLSDAATAAATGGAQPAAASPGTAPTAGDSGDAALVARRAALRRHMHRHRPMEPALFFPLAPPRGAELSSRFQP